MLKLMCDQTTENIENDPLFSMGSIHKNGEKQKANISKNGFVTKQGEKLTLGR